MPSYALSAALLLLGECDGLPWTCMAWQEHTGVTGVPWETPENASPDDPAPNAPGWTASVAQSVKIYAENLWSKSELDRGRYSTRGYTDNDAEGRNAWNAFVQSGVRQWKFNQIVDRVMKDCKLTVYDAMARLKTKTLPTMVGAQVHAVARLPLASVLFGDAAFEEDGPFLLGPVMDFCDAVLVQTWHRYRKGISRETKVMAKNESAIKAALEEMQEKGSNVSIKTLKSYLVLVRKHLTLVQRYKDKAALDKVEEIHKTLNAMYAEALNDDTKLELRQSLSKVFRDALKCLATLQDIKDIEHLINAAIDSIDREENGGVVELLEGREVDMAWKEGIEDLKDISEADLWRLLGFPEKRLPFFQEYTDPDGIVDPWSDEGIEWLKKSTSSREPLRPRWHQLIGIFRMLERAFDASPVLLMDGVGIGKTFQIVGLIASLSYYATYYEKIGKFPGKFAERKWHGKDGNIPNLPIVISCPVNIHNQWSRELRRFLAPKSVDILPYTGKLASCRVWWDMVYSQSEQPLRRRIILATESAIQDDSSMVFADLIRDVEGTTKRSAAFSSPAKSTIFGHQFLIAVMDEAHSARKFNKVHTAYHGLRKQSEAIVAMTATPVLTKLQDLWIMGAMMGIPPFASKNKYAEMTKELNRAQARDRRAEKESMDTADRLRSMLGGREVEQVASSSEFVPKLRQWIPFVRESYSKFIIRRTLDSVDNTGKKIFGLPLYHVHVLVLELREWEKKRLMDITAELIDHCPVTALAGAGKNFYIEFRRGLLHPHMNPQGNNEGWKRPLSLDDWKTNYASTKLDALLEIVTHHLAVDNAPPLSVGPDKQTLVPLSDKSDDLTARGECDRIVIFSLFPSSNPAIQDVLKLQGIKALELNGRIPPQKRKTVLDEFRTSTREVGSRVLILSMVGTVGLNLACANIMIIADTLWSALDDEQLRGRIYRYPQQKEVHFYRLIAGGTPDVFLNNIAFDKGVLHDAFVGIDSHSLQLFSGPIDDNDEDVTRVYSLEDDLAMDPDDNEVAPSATYGKGGSKKARVQALSPTRPPAKRAAPTSPTSLLKSKKAKQGKAMVTKGKEKANDPSVSTASTSMCLPVSTLHPAIIPTSVSAPPAAVPTTSHAQLASAPPALENQQQHKLSIRSPSDVIQSFLPTSGTAVPRTSANAPMLPTQLDASVKDVSPPPQWNAGDDPIFQMAQTGLTQETDPETLDDVTGQLLVMSGCASSSALSTPPRDDSPSSSLASLPPLSRVSLAPTISRGIKARSNAPPSVSQSCSGTSISSSIKTCPGPGVLSSTSRSHAVPRSNANRETIGGVDLIPGRRGQLKAGTVQGKHKGKKA